MKFEDRLAVVSQCFLLEGLETSVHVKLAEHSVVRSFCAGETIFLRGDIADALLLLVSGTVRLSLSSATGREFVANLAVAGDIVGHIDIAPGGNHELDGTAQERTVILWLPYRTLQALSSREIVQQRAISLLHDYAASLVTVLEDVALHPLETRLARVLSRLNGRPYMSLDRLNQGLIAAMANASRPKVNRHLQELLRLGAIDIQAGSLSVRSTAALERLAANRS